jgi:hypothetical protein
MPFKFVATTVSWLSGSRTLSSNRQAQLRSLVEYTAFQSCSYLIDFSWIFKGFANIGVDASAAGTSAWYPTLSTMTPPQMCQMTSISMAPSPSASTLTYHHSLPNSQLDENQYGTQLANISYGAPNLDIYGKVILDVQNLQLPTYVI